MFTQISAGLIALLVLDLLTAAGVSLATNALLRGRLPFVSWLCGAVAPSILLIAFALSLGPEPPGSRDAHGMIIVAAFIGALPLAGFNALVSGVGLMIGRPGRGRRGAAADVDAF